MSKVVLKEIERIIRLGKDIKRRRATSAEVTDFEAMIKRISAQLKSKCADKQNVIEMVGQLPQRKSFHPKENKAKNFFETLSIIFNGFFVARTISEEAKQRDMKFMAVSLDCLIRIKDALADDKK